jgi:demethylmenaquinone methyltransferase/2-methoxy-6-polyprenyl-1,4-benzoquinol methylase
MSKGVQKVFSEAARTYEMINHLLTFGLDVLWRRKTAQLASAVGGLNWLDVCGGTGEMAVSLYRVAEKNTRIVSSDFSVNMLRRAKKKEDISDIQLTLADSGKLPFADNSFDLVVISYATRNLNVTREKLVSYLEEFRRVIRDNGTFMDLETSQPSSRIIRNLYHLYIRGIVRNVGSLISGSKTGYAYLSYTVSHFHDHREFSKILHDAGFMNIRVKRFLFGTFALHQATA